MFTKCKTFEVSPNCQCFCSGKFLLQSNQQLLQTPNLLLVFTINYQLALTILVYHYIELACSLPTEKKFLLQNFPDNFYFLDEMVILLLQAIWYFFYLTSNFLTRRGTFLDALSENEIKSGSLRFLPRHSLKQQPACKVLNH